MKAIIISLGLVVLIGIVSSCLLNGSLNQSSTEAFQGKSIRL
ncbi:MAG: hypothetical protein ACRBBJ_10315 [Rhodomicrobiaceae bacterium]